MAWITTASHTDDENGIKVEKQHRQRHGRGNETRYLVQINQERFVYLSRTQLFDVTDTLDDICDKIDEGDF